MKKTLIVIGIGVIGAYSNSLIVKDDSVKIKVDNKDYSLEKDETLTLEDGATVCFEEGKGRIIINEEKQLNAKSENACLSLAIKEDFTLSKWLKEQVKSVAVLFSDSKEKVESGISRAETSAGKVKQQNYKIPDKEEEVVIYSESFGPLPITLTLLGDNDEVIQIITNEDSVKTLFRLPTDKIKKDYKLKVTNAFDETLLDVLVVE